MPKKPKRACAISPNPERMLTRTNDGRGRAEPELVRSHQPIDGGTVCSYSGRVDGTARSRGRRGAWGVCRMKPPASRSPERRPILKFVHVCATMRMKLALSSRASRASHCPIRLVKSAGRALVGGDVKYQGQGPGAAQCGKNRITLKYRPLGVIGAITPWNVPVGLASHKISQGLLAENPWCSSRRRTRRWRPCCWESCRGTSSPGCSTFCPAATELGQHLTEHPGIDRISFTGSVATGETRDGQRLRHAQARDVELGGNDRRSCSTMPISM